jgi:hypothetical protein
MHGAKRDRRILPVRLEEATILSRAIAPCEMLPNGIRGLVSIDGKVYSSPWRAGSRSASAAVPSLCPRRRSGNSCACNSGPSAATSPARRRTASCGRTQKEDPKDIPEVDVPAASNNEACRLVQGGGVTVGPERTKLADGNAAIEAVSGLLLRVGSRKIVRVRVV